MGKLFTITSGLENLGALKTGGQGSVYKAKRGGTIVAVKLLSTPIHSKNNSDRNFLTFQNEVEKLKKVSQEPNPYVVKILNSGLTDSGNFPFIEMEYIEGPDIEDLLTPPHDPFFSIEEIIKVADQLANALSHCHTVKVMHGDIKSNNVKLDKSTGNYVLLDFGLAIMSDEERRTSMRQAGAIEFMAPEQNDGIVYFQTDVYSYGIVLFELLTGSVPFPLTDKGETSRNKVMLGHVEKPVPDILSQRRSRLPSNWSEEKKEQEMKVPEWVTNVVYKCLEKSHNNRFVNGMELHKHIRYNYLIKGPGGTMNTDDPGKLSPVDGAQIPDRITPILKSKKPEKKTIFAAILIILLVLEIGISYNLGEVDEKKGIQKTILTDIGVATIDSLNKDTFLYSPDTLILQFKGPFPEVSDPGIKGLPKFLADVNLDGILDFGRFVGNKPRIFLSFQLGIKGNSRFSDSSYQYNSYINIDKGILTKTIWLQDVNKDGRLDYCRYVGDYPNIRKAALLSTPTGFDGDHYYEF